MSSEDFYFWLTNGSIVSVIIPICACFIRAKFLTKTVKILFLYLFSCLIADGLSFFFSDQKEVMNNVRNLFTIIECLCLCLIYYIETGDKVLRKVILCTFILFMVLGFKYYIIDGRLTKFEMVVSIVEAAILVSFSTVYLLTFLFSSQIKNLENHYFFWIVLSNLAYFGTALVFFMFRNFIKNAPSDISNLLWGLHDIINIGCNLLFTIAIWKTQKK